MSIKWSFSLFKVKILHLTSMMGTGIQGADLLIAAAADGNNA
jgi:hypothetical protein